MRAVIGLGNPGPEYARTKHNAGFWVVDRLAALWKLSFRPGKGSYFYAEARSGQVVLAKPATGMNACGPAVKEIMTHWKVQIEDLLVIVDDVDLPLGTLRIRPRGGDGCHRGLESIIVQLGDTGFPRLRLGIATSERTRPAENYVLRPFRPRDRAAAEIMVNTAAEAVIAILAEGLERTMNRYNRIQATGDEPA